MQNPVINIAPSQKLFCEAHAKFSWTNDMALSPPQTHLAPPSQCKKLREALHFPCSGLREASAAQDRAGCRSHEEVNAGGQPPSIVSGANPSRWRRAEH